MVIIHHHIEAISSALVCYVIDDVIVLGTTSLSIQLFYGVILGYFA